MAIREDNSIEISLPSMEKFNNKSDIRDFILKQWIYEEPNTKYRYFVDTFDNGSRIYLERPGRLNKGCDFVIYAENAHMWKNGNDRPPDHKFVFNDLIKKKNAMSIKDWENFLQAVGEIYNSNPYNYTLKYTTNLIDIGYSYELILKLIRWFFIEQDVTYWSGQGRNMFYNGVNEL